VLFTALGANTIWDANEAYYVDTPAHMVRTGDYVTPVFNGLTRLNKPVLSYWIVAGLYRLFGISVTVERLGIALGALGIVLSAFALGWAVRSTRTAVLSALVVATAPRVLMWARRIFIDVYITCFMSMALACFALAWRDPARRRLWLLLMYVGMGLGVLTKGPVAVFFPAVAGAIWLTVEHRWREWRSLAPATGILIILAIVLPWYVALYRVHGWEPIRQFLVGENFQRYASSRSPDYRSVWFFVPVLLSDLFPWAPVVAIALVTAWRREPTSAPPDAAAMRRLLWIWIVAVVSVFSFSQQKEDLYIFPAVAASAALIADVVDRGIAGDVRLRVAPVLSACAVMCIAAAAAGWWLFGSGYYALAGIGTAASLLGVGSLSVLWLLARRRLRDAVTLMAATMVAFNYALFTRVVPSIERLKPVAPIAAVMRERSGPLGNLGYYHLSLASLPHYAGRDIVEIGNVEHAKSFFYNANGAWVVMSPESYDELRRVISPICVAYRHPMLNSDLAHLLQRQPPDDVLLVTNRGCPAS